MDLLEALVRPDDLTSHVLAKEVKFLASHKATLLRLESALNPFPASPMVGGGGDPVQLSHQVPDRVHPPELMRTSDDAYNKIMVCLMALCEEVGFLKGQAEGRFYAPLYLFGFSANDDMEEWSDGLLEAQVGLMLPLLQDLANFVARIHTVVHALVRQVRALFLGRFAGGFREIKLGPVVSALGDALRVLITLDAILAGNRLMGPAWQKYKRLADIIRVDPSKFGYEGDTAVKFFDLLSTLDQGLLQGRTFSACIDQAFESVDETRGFLGTGGNTGGGKGAGAPPPWVVWLRESCLERLSGALGGIGGDSETNEALQAVGQFGVYALYRVLVGGRASGESLSGDFYSLWKMGCERLPLVVLWGGKTVWKPEEFLLAYVNIPGGPSLKKLVPKDPGVVRSAAADALEASLPSLANLAHARLTGWLVRAHSLYSDTAPTRQNPLETTRARCYLLIQALSLAYSLNRALTASVAFTFTLGRPVKRKVLAPLARIAETLKVLEATLHSHNASISEAIPQLLREYSATLCESLAPLRLKAGGQKAGMLGSEVARFIHAGGELVGDLCISTESWSPARRVLLELGLSSVCQKEGLSAPPAMAKVAECIWNINFLAEHATHTLAACSTAPLYALRDLFPGMVASAVTLSGEAPHDLFAHHGARLPFLAAAFSDPARWLASAAHLPPPPPPSRRIVRDELLVSGESAPLFGGAPSSPPSKKGEGGAATAVDKGLDGVVHLLTSYERYLQGILKADLVNPLCTLVERDLREQVHAAQGTHRASSFVSKPPLVYLLALPPFRVISALVDFRTEVTQYLEKNFYELTTVALHDWKTYGEMSALAAERYGLNLTDNSLPMGCLDQGLDVLQIMRNIHIFSARYAYNLNQQFFIEKKSVKGAKHLNSVNIQSISSSIRQHGSGMINTTVNFAYQFLSQKFSVFSQFLFDDYIKSYLARERKFFRASRKDLDNRYPYDHASALQVDIKKLGLAPTDKQSFLDKFRGLVCEVGNALGYVRMVRTAGMHATAEAIKFVPDVTAMPKFEEAARAVETEGVAAAEAARAEEVEQGGKAEDIPIPTGLSPHTLEAAANLDAVLANLSASFAEGSDFFKLLVTVFHHVLLSPTAAPPPAAAAAGGGGSGSGSGGNTGESHLRNFFLIVPALTLSFVDSLRTAKDRMEKNVKGTECYFTDDGFAVGLAYILAILKQDRSFDSLHWWDSIKRYHRAQLVAFDTAERALGPSKGDSEKREEINFKRRSLLVAEVEFDSLFYAFSCARLLFKSDGSTEDDEVTLSVDKMLA